MCRKRKQNNEGIYKYKGRLYVDESKQTKRIKYLGDIHSSRNMGIHSFHFGTYHDSQLKIHNKRFHIGIDCMLLSVNRFSERDSVTNNKM